MTECHCGRMFLAPAGETECGACAAARLVVDAGNARHLALPLFAAPQTMRGQLDLGA